MWDEDHSSAEEQWKWSFWKQTLLKTSWWSHLRLKMIQSRKAERLPSSKCLTRNISYSYIYFIKISFDNKKTHEAWAEGRLYNYTKTPFTW